MGTSEIQMPDRKRITMKTTILGASLLRTVLGTAALLACTAAAQAANPFVAGSKWTGFRVSTVGGGSSNATLNVSNNPSTGILNLTGQNIPVSIAYNASGSFTFQGLGISFAGVKVMGMVGPQGGTFSLSGNYSIANVPGAHNDKGRLSLLRSYKTIPGGQTVIGSTAGAGLLPPGPCFGSFQSVAGVTGRMYLTHNLPLEIGELNPPSNFTGDIYFVAGDGSVRLAAVGTINPEANPDGTHNIEVLGEDLVGGSPFSSVKTTGMLLPAVRTNPLAIVGYYELIGLLRSDKGRFQLGQ